MVSRKSDIIKKLEAEILPLQGYKSGRVDAPSKVDLGPVNEAFPGSVFPTGAVHEFISHAEEEAVASIGFMSGIIGHLMKNAGPCIWISATRLIFPPALLSFGIKPERVIFIELSSERERLWAMEESLKCEGLSAVIGDIRDISLVASRRLQLAVEQSQVTGFLLRRNPKTTNPIAALARWKIRSRPSQLADGLPGVGFPRWEVAIEKIRNGKPGTWELEWREQQFQPVFEERPVSHSIRKTG